MNHIQNTNLHDVVEQVVKEQLTRVYGLVQESKRRNATIALLKEAAEDLRNQGKDEKESKVGVPHDVRKSAIKTQGGGRKDFNAKNDKTYNRDTDDMQQSEIADELNSGYFNISKIAQEIYPDHTKEGAQSQLRKKLKGETADSGFKYHLKKKEINALRPILNKVKQG